MYFFLFYPMPLIPFRVSVLYSFHRMFQFWERERKRERRFLQRHHSYFLFVDDFWWHYIARIDFVHIDGYSSHSVCANIWKIRLFVLWCIWSLVYGEHFLMENRDRLNSGYIFKQKRQSPFLCDMTWLIFCLCVRIHIHIVCLLQSCILHVQMLHISLHFVRACRFILCKS